MSKDLLSAQLYQEKQVPVITLHPYHQGMNQKLKAEDTVLRRLFDNIFSRAKPNQLNTDGCIAGNFEGLPTVRIERPESSVNPDNPVPSAQYIFPIHPNSLSPHLRKRFGFLVGGEGCEKIHRHGNGTPGTGLRNVRFHMGQNASLEILTFTRPIIVGFEDAKDVVLNRSQMDGENVSQVEVYDSVLQRNVWHTVIGNQPDGSAREFGMRFDGSGHAFRYGYNKAITGERAEDGPIWAFSEHGNDILENQGTGITGQSMFFEMECAPRPDVVRNEIKKQRNVVADRKDDAFGMNIFKGYVASAAALVLYTMVLFPVKMLQTSDESIFLKKHRTSALVQTTSERIVGDESGESTYADKLVLTKDLYDLIKTESPLLKIPTAVAAACGIQPRLEYGNIPADEIVAAYQDCGMFGKTKTITYSEFMKGGLNNLISEVNKKDARVNVIEPQRIASR